MAKKRGNNEGSITRRKDGLWMAQVTIGRDPATGTLKRATFYGKTRQDVADKLTKALVEEEPRHARGAAPAHPGAAAYHLAH